MRAVPSTIIRRFIRDRRGNIAVIFALACVPLITAVGCAVDYSRATQTRAKLQAAADAASVGSIAKASPAFKAAGTMTSDGSISVGVTDAQNIFDANRANLTGYTLNSATPTVVKTGSTVTSTVAFNATMNTMFLGLIGKTALTLSGTSKATASMPLYIDFYLLLDNSPSMGVAATPDDVTKMVNNTSDKCAFACHDYNDSNNYYNLAKTLGVTTRIDVLRSATQSLMDTAAATQTYSNQFRMAIYDFGASSKTIGLRALFSLSSSLSSAKTAAGNIDLMGVYGNNDSYTKDQDTQFSTLFPAISNEIPNPGSGTSNSPLKYLFFVSDGVADESNAGCLKPLSGSSRCQSPLNASLCKAMKDRGVKIAVLYTTYLKLPTNKWYMDWIDPFNQGPFGPSPNSQIAQNMQSCASPGFYFEVSPTQGISEAMNALFKKAVADARISG
ncbi:MULTISPECIES: TadE/TadG family type IV pilus assembly protein [Bradyrhizobium]|uniref:TadE/TadG family type IV pilus assembly protein n=1 Tax=Bradyrhizobium TaxID=374 RepID=UPI001BA6A7DD|nr:pilus assembly protein TadG-related protein [Bradyrhizobium liaoningense]MBR0984471.1 pilus assembly protein [Bradyrhizobium liaoningense]GMO37941.1 pilus assembly protein [Bradyrhizobium sp. TM233]GMP08223.1 pilus assembly protein [Bradyrhizobium sp. TM239]